MLLNTICASKRKGLPGHKRNARIHRKHVKYTYIDVYIVKHYILIDNKTLINKSQLSKIIMQAGYKNLKPRIV